MLVNRRSVLPLLTDPSRATARPGQIGSQAPRVSGVLLPVFSARSAHDFGIGDFGSLKAIFPWLKQAGQSAVMILPLLPTGNSPSPYSARCAFGLNPLYIDFNALPEFAAMGGIDALSTQHKTELEAVRKSQSVQYERVVPLKQAILRRAYEQFRHEAQAHPNAPRVQAVEKFAQEQKDWLADYALFEALSAEQGGSAGDKAWWEWPEPLKTRDAQALGAARARLKDEIDFHTWAQCVTHEQWRKVRSEAKAAGILVGGDEPFTISKHSADAWAHPNCIKTDKNLGAPGDSLRPQGQDWGLPYFDFDEMAKDGYQWLRSRASAAAKYYDFRRLDHIVGYARQWVIDSKTNTAGFVPADAKKQETFARTHFQLLSEGADVLAEDLGAIPPFVTQALADLDITEYRVLRWENDAQGNLLSPKAFPKASIVTTGTHDTSNLISWWNNELTAEEKVRWRRAYPALCAALDGTDALTPAARLELLRIAEFASSQLAIVPIQDIIGSDVQTNYPGTNDARNWAYGLEVPVEALSGNARTADAARTMKKLTEEAGRSLHHQTRQRTRVVGGAK